MYTETVKTVRHWTDRLFSFTTTRNPGLRFINGQFVMIGLPINGRPLLRAYSLCSANHEDQLEFFSIKVPNGPLTQHLQKLQPGDEIIVGGKPTGTLVQDSLKPGKYLLMLSTGTGLAPFVSVIKDPDAYERYEKIILVHGCRFINELSYGEKVVENLMQDEFFGELAQEKLLYYPTVTREPFKHNGRITALLEQGKLEADLSLPALNTEDYRVMLCGSPEMLSELQTMLEARGFDEGSHSQPGQYVIEKAFVEK
ncbi:ferredoxin--NADP reductase [Acidocella aminolytica]|jgi:ferredoxin--NADP+ reductase|uniref:ferredoxin--NADP(+) reductase n=2 Tax=Acidocella TaxID=50709 RepID=A0A0D6PI93_9PROT|nr:ferredoxin--NADP reductase [Acidocella aminolytica 101 = DSM 11237]GBQ41352.1 ferredoxin-NADP reductase [Acidocella aminolytica 101 = DSM 11237]